MDVTAAFRTFDGEPVSLAFRLPADAVRESSLEFGSSPQEIEQMAARCAASATCSQDLFEERLAGYYRSRALRSHVERDGRHVGVDVPAAARRNVARMRAVALALRRLAAERGLGEDHAIDLAVALVQTALDYQVPPQRDGDRDIYGFLTPPQALASGYGDCDTKAALLAAILVQMGTRVIGVHVPNHYLLAVARPALPGQAYLRVNGQSYVLIEASGPAAMEPGRIADATRAALDSGRLRIDPI